MKVKRIVIKSLGDSLQEFAATYHRVAQRKPVANKGGVFFASIDAVRKVLTANRLNILRVIKHEEPNSIYELAKLTHRDFKNVAQDIAFLADLGLVDLAKPRGAKKRRRPILISDRFAVEFAV